MKKLMFFIAAAIPFMCSAQDDLVKKLDNNKSDSAKNKYVFTNIIDLGNTSVKNQASSGTCWSYSTNSFLESEMMRMGKEPVELSQIYSARMEYGDKADVYVRMHGGLVWGDGGEAHDVINMYAKYGAMPQLDYTGLHYGTAKNKFAELQGILKSMLEVVVSNPNGKLSTAWKEAFNSVLDAYLGKIPETFTYKGRTYTPKSFASEVVGINPKDYVELSSFTYAPYYKKTMLMVPDNWEFAKVYNVKLNDITDIIDYALKHGYTVAWGADVSEKYFSWKNGVAYVPEKDYDDMDDSEKKNMFNGPKPERKITPDLREEAFDDYQTTDDHGMHIVGLAKDQNGKEYYIVKNSWGVKNDYKGYIYVTKAYMQYKTTTIMLNKNGLPNNIKDKLDLD
ncbi:MAG TPA: C1 family peptidase [Flavipsychrobacter sp.]|nr:C1 family peptidase [Flavipsychrobacter sp.]